MTFSASLSVLHDVFTIAGMVLLAGVIVYAVIRSQTDHAWNYEGNVLTRPYGFPDALVALGVMILFGWGALQISDPGKSAEVSAHALSPVIELVAGISQMMVFGILLMLYMRVYRKLDPAEMFGIRNLSLPVALGVAVLSFIAIWLCILATIALLKEHAFGGVWPDESAQFAVESFRKVGSLPYKLMLGIGAIFIAPLTEEIIFRGFLYGVIKRYTDRWFSTFFTALFFAAVHQHVGSLFPLFTLAIGLAVVYEATGCLLVPIFIHAIFNGFNIGVMIMQ